MALIGLFFIASACTGSDTAAEGARRITAEHPAGSDEVLAARLLHLLDLVWAIRTDQTTVAVARASIAADRFRAICDHPELPDAFSSACSHGKIAIEGVGVEGFGAANDALYGFVSRARAASLNADLQPDWDISTPMSDRLTELADALAQQLRASPRIGPQGRENVLTAIDAIESACGEADDQTVPCALLETRTSSLRMALMTPVECGSACVDYPLYVDERELALLAIGAMRQR